MKPEITLINWTPDPLETVWILWEASKTDNRLTTYEPAALVAGTDGEPADDGWPNQDQLEELFWKVLRQQIPIGEHINFIFMLEGVSVSFREQMVRHRIGTHVGDRLGVDIVPDLPDSTFWSQSMRIQNMGTFADREMYRVPDSLKGKEAMSEIAGSSMPAEVVFHHAMRAAQSAYNSLVAAGVPMEDARELIPLGAQHRISWGLNLQSLLHILGKRGCWILQLGLWGPIIQGMVDELATKVHPMFRRLVAPPCIDQDNRFKSCSYRLENERRLTADDDHPPCPLYLCKDSPPGEELPHDPKACKFDLLAVEGLVHRQDEMNERAKEYERLWGMDPYLWESE